MATPDDSTARTTSAASRIAAGAATAAAGASTIRRPTSILSIRLSELTKTRVSFDGAREPNHLVVRLTDEALFQCPVRDDDRGRRDLS